MSILIATVVSVITLVPAHLDYGVDIIINASFTIFTIVFLTWMVRVREDGAWRNVEDEVLNRISRHFGEILREIEGTFLSGFDLPEVKKRMMDERDFLLKFLPESERPKSQLDEPSPLDYHWIEHAILEHYSDIQKIKLGKAWKELLRTRYDDMSGRIARVIDSFQRHRDFLARVTSEYSRFLDPKLIHSTMIIEDALDKMAGHLQLFILAQQDPSEREYLKDSLEAHLQSPILTIICVLDKMKELVYLDLRTLKDWHMQYHNEIHGLSKEFAKG